jgi:hypothetical protein
MTCSACGARRSLSELLEVRHYRTGRFRYVCRPNVDPRCFASVGPASVERIAAADRQTERAGFAAWPPEPTRPAITPQGGNPE